MKCTSAPRAPWRRRHEHISSHPELLPPFGRETALRGKRIDEDRERREDHHQPLRQTHLSRTESCPNNRSHPSPQNAQGTSGITESNALEQSSQLVAAARSEFGDFCFHKADQDESQVTYQNNCSFDVIDVYYGGDCPPNGCTNIVRRGQSVTVPGDGKAFGNSTFDCPYPLPVNRASSDGYYCGDIKY